MRWPWERRAAAETAPEAALPEDATERWLRELYRGTDAATVWETAAVEAAAGLWSRVLSAAEVSPEGPAMAAVTPAFLAWAGRALILRGNAVALIDVMDGMATLLPCLGFDVDGGPNPSDWTYRVDVAGPSAHRSRRVPAAGVVHLRWAVRQGAPWRGLSPIREARATGALHARATGMAAFLADPVFSSTYARIPPARENERVADPTPEQVTEVAEAVNAKFREKATGDRIPVFNRTELQAPRRDAVTEHERETIADSGSGILAACGIPPQLLSTSGEATVAREAWRLFYLASVAPVARQIEAELRAKLNPAAMLGFDMLRASDQDQISRATERRARAYKVLVEAGLDKAVARRLAGLD